MATQSNFRVHKNAAPLKRNEANNTGLMTLHFRVHKNAAPLKRKLNSFYITHISGFPRS